MYFGKIQRKVLSGLLILFSLFAAVNNSTGEGSLYAASYKTYDTSYDAILAMYLRVLPAECRAQSIRRHDLYNQFMYADLSPHIMEAIMTPEFDNLDENRKKKKSKELQEKTLSYIKSIVGYAILDINNDGIDELLIGRDKSYIYEIFTMDNGQVRELIKAGYRDSWNLLEDGTMLRHRVDGGAHHGVFLYRMNGTNPVEYVEGYYSDGEIGYQNGWADQDCWFRVSNPKNTQNLSLNQHVPQSEAAGWLADCESRYANIHFIPLAAYEKGFSGDGVAVLSVSGKTSGTQKVRVRSKPDKKSKIVVQKKVGTYVKALQKNGEYYQVQVGKKKGYVHEDYIILLTDLPFIYP